MFSNQELASWDNNGTSVTDKFVAVYYGSSNYYSNESYMSTPLILNFGMDEGGLIELNIASDSYGPLEGFAYLAFKSGTTSLVGRYGAVKFTNAKLVYGAVAPEPDPDPVPVPFTEDFEETLKGWKFIDSDDDGFNWEYLNGSNYKAHSGTGVIASLSYDNTSSSALFPDNWAFTPEVILANENYINFWVSAQDFNYKADHYGVYIIESSKGLEDLSAAELLFEDTFSASEYEEINVQIPASYAGKTVRVGFRHFNCSDWYQLNIDDVSILEGTAPVQEVASYESYLGQWSVGLNTVWTIAQNVAGESYLITGIAGQDGYAPVDALYENGKIVAKNKGEAKITVKSKDTGVSATCNVKVVKKVTEISISESAVNLNVGDESTLNYTIGPDDATNKEVEWISSNSDVVSVDNGKVIAKKTGTANITVKSKDTGISASCKITVTARVESIELQKNSYTVIKGKKLTINPVIKPEYATNKEYTISSDDENIVKIENNVIVGVNEGKTNVTFTTKDQNKSVKAEINVINISDSDFITFDETLKVNEDNGYVSKIEPNTKTSSIFDKMEYNKDKFDVVIKNINGKVISDDDLIGTGTTISLVSKDSREEIQTFTVIIYGDVNGDGKISAVDYTLIKNHIMDIKKINNVYQCEGANVNKDSKISAVDYTLIKNHIMDIKYINQ